MKIGVVMGSDSDYPVVAKALEILKAFDVKATVRVLSAHRTPHEALDFAAGAEEEGVEVIIAAAGKSAHLPGVMAALTAIPVIGLPILSSTLDGLDSLLSIVQMPKGIPVATVAINGGENAGILAVQMLSVKYPRLREAMKTYREKMREEVLIKDRDMIEKTRNYR